MPRRHSQDSRKVGQNPRKIVTVGTLKRGERCLTAQTLQRELQPGLKAWEVGSDCTARTPQGLTSPWVSCRGTPGTSTNLFLLPPQRPSLNAGRQLCEGVVPPGGLHWKRHLPNHPPPSKETRLPKDTDFLLQLRKSEAHRGEDTCSKL